MNSWVQIRKDAREEKIGSIILSANESSREKVGHTTGVIVALPEYVQVHKVDKNEDGFTASEKSDGVKPEALGLNIGARVLFRRYLADLHELSDGTCLIQWQDLLAIVPVGAKVSDK
jgi:hypothetical protein